MVASQDTMNYTDSGQSSTSSLREDRVRVPRLNALKFLQWGCKMSERGRRRVERDCPNEVSRGSPLDGSPSHTYIESGGQVTNGDGFSRPSGREPEGGETSKLGLQRRQSCLGVSVHLGVLVIMVLCPRHSMVWRDATVPVVTALLAWRWFASCTMCRGLAVAFAIVSCPPRGVVATVREYWLPCWS